MYIYIHGRNWQLTSIIEHRRPKHLFCRCIWLINYMEIILFFWFEGLAIMVLELSMRARAVYKSSKMLLLQKKNLNARSDWASSGTKSFISSFMMFNVFGLRVQLFWISCWSTMRARALSTRDIFQFQAGPGENIIFGDGFQDEIALGIHCTTFQEQRKTPCHSNRSFQLSG